MRRTAFIILGATAAIVALLLIGAAIAIKTLDPNRFVAPLAARVKAATGRELAVRGPIDIKVSLTAEGRAARSRVRERAVVEDAADADGKARRSADRVAAIAVAPFRSDRVHPDRAGDHARNRCRRTRQLGVRYDDRAADCAGRTRVDVCDGNRDRHRQLRDPAGHAHVPRRCERQGRRRSRSSGCRCMPAT